MNLKKHRIQLISQRMSRLSLASIIIIPLTLAWVWISENPMSAAEIPGLEIHNINQTGVNMGLTPPQRIMGFFACLLPAGMVMWGLWHLKRLFDCFGAFELFTSQPILHLKGFAKALVFTAPLEILSGILISVITSYNNPPGQGVIAISLGSGQMSLLFIGFVILIISQVMGEGQKIKEENEQFV